MPNSQPRFGGRTLLGHLEVIETERDAVALGKAYLGVVNLSDQFATREEFFDTVKKLVVDHGGSITFNNRATFRSATGKGVSKLTGDELRLLTTNFLIREGDASTMNTLKTLFQMREFRSSFERAFTDPDELFHPILESGRGNSWALIESIIIYSKLRPKSETLKKSVIALVVENAKKTSSPENETRVIFKIDPESEFLTDLVRRVYDARNEGLAFAYYEAFAPGSSPALNSIPFLVQILHSPDLYIGSKNEHVLTATLAAQVLARYSKSPAAAKIIVSEFLPFVEKGLAKGTGRKILDAANGMGIEPASEFLELQKVAAEKYRKLRQRTLRPAN